MQTFTERLLEELRDLRADELFKNYPRLVSWDGFNKTRY